MTASPERRRLKGLGEVESALNRSLKNENDLLRCQVNDLIAREKSQRVELQRLRQHRDADVSSMVQSGTSQLKAEVDQLKNMLQSTSGQLLQALSEREQWKTQKEQGVRALEELKQASMAQESTLRQQLQLLEEALSNSVSMVTSLVDTVEAFQRHVLPTFKASGFVNKGSPKVVHESGEGKALMGQLIKLENGLALLRVIVDAKNDTLVLIRGKLKEENDELKAELQSAREAAQDTQMHLKHNSPSPPTEVLGNEKIVIRQELQSLQNLFNEEVRQLKEKLRMYESEEQHGQGRLIEVQKELAALQNKLSSVEASRSSLEASLKEETSARSQLVSQLFTLRKDNEKTRTELETLKLSQKFLVRQPRSGHIPLEKMDLMNTVNQLLVEMNKLKGEKVALEEELKAQKRSQVRDRVNRTVTSRDVEMAASNKVGDTELATKLARARIEQLGLQEGSNAIASDEMLIECPNPTSKSNMTTSPDITLDYVHNTGGLQGTQSIDKPSREDIMNCATQYASTLPARVG